MFHKYRIPRFLYISIIYITDPSLIDLRFLNIISLSQTLTDILASGASDRRAGNGG